MIEIFQFGGGTIRVSNKEYDFIHLPDNVEYLFNNIMIEIISFLCVLSCFKKNMKLDELLFYYCLAVSYVDLRKENNNLNFGVKNAQYEANSLYLYMKEKEQYIITYLANCGFLELSVDNSTHPHNILISINEKGRKCTAQLQNKYFSNLIQRTRQVIKDAKYTKVNRDKVFRGEYYDVD